MDNWDFAVFPFNWTQLPLSVSSYSEIKWSNTQSDWLIPGVLDLGFMERFHKLCEPPEVVYVLQWFVQFYAKCVTVTFAVFLGRWSMDFISFPRSPRCQRDWEALIYFLLAIISPDSRSITSFGLKILWLWNSYCLHLCFHIWTMRTPKLLDCWKG